MPIVHGTPGHFEGALVYNASTFSATARSTAGGTMDIPYSGKEYDTNNIYDSGSNTKLTCRTAGKYHVCGNISMGSPPSATGRYRFTINKNGLTTIAEDFKLAAAGATNYSFSLNAGAIIDLVAGNEIYSTFQQDTASEISISAGGARLGMQRVG